MRSGEGHICSVREFESRVFRSDHGGVFGGEGGRFHRRQAGEGSTLPWERDWINMEALEGAIWARTFLSISRERISLCLCVEKNMYALLKRRGASGAFL